MLQQNMLQLCNMFCCDIEKSYRKKHHKEKYCLFKSISGCHSGRNNWNKV